MRKTTRILLTGGGSGGHIQPNLAIATAVKSRCGSNGGYRSDDCRVEILYVGSRSPFDRQLVEAAQIPFFSILTGKLRRYFSWQNFVDPIFVIIGFFQALFILIRFWPHVVFAKGGFVSLPVAFAAFLLRRPIVLHESDSVMGLSNRIVAKLATKICVAFPNVIAPSNKVVFTGNPVRLSVQGGNADEGYRLTGFRPEKPVVLVWGGSQGSEEINDRIIQEFHRLKSVFQIIHVTGQGKRIDCGSNGEACCGAASRGANCGVEGYVQFEYLGDELKHIYAITDFAVGRAGANSL
ncbi:MAG: UDP-N-acetylglucosamine--N-acetylmuramyl-(pentapeptide) pyrophosphoryl-undecaprenol N-acetylglucosamine transferase, partial [Candidatus Magasanikbacteria bacterium]|nr:UDP-N-acetylglucosamine--N-acetylmuramyl-(pentapeptide) pyrophosphoryl-undecaprenol N-acetylglucosamine transferase [Candidatus Magasanikbacteria bacterium]